MPRFNFPIPGRRSKAKQPLSPALPSPGGPGPRQQLTSLTKAQRILGTSDINVDGGTWDAWSNSGISISISEDGESVADEGRAARRRQEGGQDREGRDEAESGVMPRALDRRLAALGAGGGGEAAGDVADDASSVRRRGSSSTIASYYDKSKQPLSISQQTSSSAMAMGIPAIQPGAAAERKKKPARLDLSHMVPRLVNRSSQANLPGGGRSSRASVIGREKYKQPAQEQASHPPPIRQRAESKLVDPKHRNSMADLIGSALRRDSRVEDTSRSAGENGVKAAQSQANALHSLYSHYEQQLVFRGMLSPPQAEDASKSTFSPSSQGYLSPDTVASGSTARPESGDLSTPRDGASGTETPETPDTAVHTPQQPAPPGFGSISSKALAAAGLGDCSASVSSRHTRTSKASKRTTQSGFEMDLKQNSVLSLSSDSDDDLFATSRPSGSAPPESPGDPPTSELPPLPPGARSSVALARRNPRAATPLAATKRGNGVDAKAAKTAAQALAPPTVNPRTSSLATATATATAAVKQNMARAPSRLSTTSNLTINTLNSSIASIFTAGPPAGLSVHSSARQKSKAGSVRETKNIAMVPTRPTHRHQSSTASVDFYLRPQHNSSALSLEAPLEEERSEHALAQVDHAPQPKPPTRTTTTVTTTTTTTENTQPETPSSRYMAVTRQEELLLAALRLKRARMRESILAEYESSVTESRTSSRAESRASPPAPGVNSGRISRATVGGSTASRGHHRGRSSASNISVALSPRPGHRHRLSSSSSQHQHQHQHQQQQSRRCAASPTSSGHDRPASPLSPLTAAFASAAAKGRMILDAAAAAAPTRSILEEFDDLLDEADDITAAFPVPGRQSTLPATAEDRLAPLERVESSKAYRRAAAQRQAQKKQAQPLPLPLPHEAGLSPPSRQHSTRSLAPPVLAQHQQRERSPQSVRSARSHHHQRGRSGHSHADSESSDRHHSRSRAAAPEPATYSPIPRMKAVRISAVGGTAPGGVEMGWWGDDG
ncbi:hypothetical protein GGTG_08878 [Gaeumannomyces tritici R3-111a-1]|uniref:Uncharacterized protein n=1 Tax=Gaeumannomyces tritici (strain R3-111a-1) TaxID=644352 RepID=J3P5T8_GAET3|nr:hypothetical protein GGTG_08878 [Gaeumannomyces tritici R3-111a-1]EJT75040.1 hypothetical protein GGTG_08878 [Gaeumannomyces tritici R3-111a-1]